MKPGCEAREWWRHGQGVRASIVLLHLHGFSASPGEAGDLPERMAGALAANLYVHRWPGHGNDAADAMRGLSRQGLEASACAALDHARTMGERVVVVGSSLGATLGLWLAAVRPDQVAAVAAWSPGIQAAEPLLLDRLCDASVPWADDRPRTPAVRAYWSAALHSDGFRALRDTFRRCAASPPWPRVRCPVFLGYCRAPDGAEDQVASVPAMLDMFAALGTPPERKRAQPFAAGAHAIGSPHRTPLAGLVADASVTFLRQVLATGAEQGRLPAPQRRDGSVT